MSYTNTDLKGYMPNSSLVKNIFNASGSVKSADKKLEAFTNITYLNTHAKGRSETGYADLKPESTTSFEVGLEAAFLNDRIGFDLTYYKTTTTILEEQVEVVETYYDNFSECQSGCCPS